MCLCCFIFFFKQKTAYEMRISDWSSDVCSSDLEIRQEILMAEKANIRTGYRTDEKQAMRHTVARELRPEHLLENVEGQIVIIDDCTDGTIAAPHDEIGRATCRERVCQYVEISGVAVSLKKKKNTR